MTMLLLEVLKGKIKSITFKQYIKGLAYEDLIINPFLL